MIQDRLAQNRKISEEYRLNFLQEKKKSLATINPKLFDF
jgi:hypothetical protein